MSSFTELVVKALPDGNLWELYTPLTYHIGSLKSTDKIEIPVGFQTDFGSVPRIFWFIVNPQGKAKAAFVVHDWLYKTGERSKLVSDAILLEAMEVCGVGLIQRHLVWRGLQLGGWWAWRQHRKKDKSRE